MCRFLIFENVPRAHDVLQWSVCIVGVIREFFHVGRCNLSFIGPW